MKEVGINKGYELYQIITDFGEPLEIFREAFQNAIDENASEVYCNVFQKEKLGSETLFIDIWNNGNGLPKEKINCFFDLANSTKTDDNYVQMKGKLGYKGHGAKIFFNASKVIIESKGSGYHYAVESENPVQQISDKNTFYYSDFKNPKEFETGFPATWEKGFLVRIVGHLHFRTQHTLYKLNHSHIRDYIKWFTVFGTIRTLFDTELLDKNISLYLRGLDFDDFKSRFNTFEQIDPVPQFVVIDNNEYEKLTLGHYFPPNRSTDTSMKQYANQLSTRYQYYEYYSKKIFDERVSCSNGMQFHLVINAEGYETKRRYDVLLTRRGKSRTEISHTDSERFGIWACKGGVPVQKIDNWIEGTKGTFSYIQAFIDCDDFNLTANRGSINNTDIEKLTIIKSKLNEIFDSSKIKNALNERAEYEKFENVLASIDEDEARLKERMKNSSNARQILLPSGVILKEPTHLKTGYSESETLILLINLIHQYPQLFDFRLVDYNTGKGIDFVVDCNGTPKYIELKGTLTNVINHPFRHIYKFICYETKVRADDIVTDLEGISAIYKSIKNDKFHSFDDNFKNKHYDSHKLEPNTASVQSMEVICLKELIFNLIGGKYSV